MTNRTYTDFVALNKGDAPPADPHGDNVRVYADSSGTLHTLQSDGTDAEVGSGSAFNGGTITDPLTIASGDGEGDPLNVQAVPSIAGAMLVVAEEGSVSLTAQSASDTLGRLKLDIAGAVSIKDKHNDNGIVIDGNIVGFGPATNVIVSPGGFLQMEGLGVPPDDSDLGEGGVGAYAAIWFDRTPGAAKLMCKARDLNGDIVTGVICNLT